MKQFFGALLLVILAMMLWWRTESKSVENDSLPDVPKQATSGSAAKALPWLRQKGSGSVGSALQPAPELINIGEPLDPDTYLGQGAKELINIGEYIDLEADPSLYTQPSVVKNIGEYIDPEGDPNAGRTPSKLINIGEYIDADEYFFGGAKGADTLINIGEPLDPQYDGNN